MMHHLVFFFFPFFWVVGSSGILESLIKKSKKIILENNHFDVDFFFKLERLNLLNYLVFFFFVIGYLVLLAVY